MSGERNRLWLEDCFHLEIRRSLGDNNVPYENPNVPSLEPNDNLGFPGDFSVQYFTYRSEKSVGREWFCQAGVAEFAK